MKLFFQIFTKMKMFDPSMKTCSSWKNQGPVNELGGIATPSWVIFSSPRPVEKSAMLRCSEEDPSCRVSTDKLASFKQKTVQFD